MNLLHGGAMFLKLEEFFLDRFSDVVGCIEEYTPATMYHLFFPFKLVAWCLTFVAAWSMGKGAFMQETELGASFSVLLTALVFFANYHLLEALNREEKKWSSHDLSMVTPARVSCFYCFLFLLVNVYFVPTELSVVYVTLVGSFWVCWSFLSLTHDDNETP